MHRNRFIHYSWIVLCCRSLVESVAISSEKYHRHVKEGRNMSVCLLEVNDSYKLRQEADYFSIGGAEFCSCEAAARELNQALNTRLMIMIDATY